MGSSDRPFSKPLPRLSTSPRCCTMGAIPRQLQGSGVAAPIGVGVIGCGGTGPSRPLPASLAVARRGLCTLVGVCDVDAARAEAAARQVGAPAFTSVDALLEKARPEVVGVSTFPPSH